MTLRRREIWALKDRYGSAAVARMGDYHVRADLAAGRLVEVLADVVEPDEEEIHAVFLGGPRMPQRVRVFLDFIVPRLQQFLGEDVSGSDGR